MRMRHIEIWNESDMAPHLTSTLSKSHLFDIEWFRITETAVICHGLTAEGYARIGSCEFRDAKDFDPIIACRLSLFDALTKGNGYDKRREEGTQPTLEAV